MSPGIIRRFKPTLLALHGILMSSGPDSVQNSRRPPLKLFPDPPRVWRVMRDGIPRFHIERFVYTIRSRIRNDEIEFLSVVHAARHPETGMERY